MGSTHMIALFISLAFFACDHAADKPDSTPQQLVRAAAAAEPRQVEPAAAPVPGEAPAPQGTSTYMDLLALFHLADLYEPSGLFMDFGTGARAKYTNGDWNSGWYADIVESGTRVSSFGKKARVIFPIASSVPMQIRIRAKAYASGPLISYLNGQTLRETQVNAADGFTELVLPVPAGSVKPGENELMLRATKTANVQGKSRSFAIDWIRVEPEGAQSVQPKPAQVASVSAAQVERRSISLAPGARVDWFVEVPAGASLVFGSAAQSDSGKLAVQAKSDAKGKKHEMAIGAGWTDEVVSLSELEGQIARLRFVNEGQSPIALSDVRVVRAASVAALAEAQAENVIVLLVDTLRASKLQQYYPKSRVKTPVLDAFAAQGVMFERPQAPENWTKPSVASVLTSLHPASHNTKEDASKLPRSALMLSEVYQKAGFETGSFIANGYVSNAFGFDQGWDYYTNYIREQKSTTAENVFGDAIDWIEKNKDKRFFAYIQTIDPHVPYDPPDQFLKMYDPEPYSGQVKNRRTHLMMDDAKKNPKKYNFTARDKARIEALHDGEISYHDAFFGKFLDKLAELGLDQNTIIVVTSDHGEEFQEHGSWGHGHSVYQELLHVPLMLRWPGVAPAGLRVAPVVSTMDIGPTVLEATGVAVPEAFEGRSLLGFVRGDWPTGPHVAFSDFLQHRRVIRGGDWKLIVRGDLSQVMFDLKTDPWEKTELSGRENPIAQRYLRTLHGQFLGADDRGHWLAASELVSKAKPQQRKQPLPQEKQEMTPELCQQLVALGYVTDDCK